MQKRKRYQEGFIGLHDAGVSLYSLEADEALDSVIWTYTLRRDWNEARNRSATLEMLLQRHIARIQFGSGEGGLVQGSGCVAAGHGGATEGRFSVNVGMVNGDMFRSAGAIEGHAFGGICRPSIGPVEDNEFEAILRTAKTKAKPEVEDEGAALLLQPSKAPRRAPLPIMGSIEEAQRDSAMPAFPPYCPPRTPFDLLDLEFAVPSEGGDNSTQLSSTHVAMSMHSYTLLHLDTLYRSLYFGLRDLATGSRLARSAQFKRCPLGSTCKLKMTDKGEARLYFPAHSQANSKRKRGGSKLFFKASSMSGKETRMETPDIFLFSVKGAWVVYASAWRGLNPQGLLRVEPLTEATRRVQDGLVVGSTTACDTLHCLEGVGQRLQYLETLRTLLSTKCEEGSDHEGDAFNVSSGSRASLDPGAICCTSLCLFGGLVSGHRLLNRSLTLPTAVDLDACMEATMELFPNLNSDQIAVLKHVQAWFTDNTAEPLIMVQGVYGSGKTTVLAAVISLLCEVLVASCGPVIPIAHRRVGLLSLTNVAVDNVLLKLKSKGFEDFVRLGVYDRIAANLRDDFFARTQSRSRMEGPPGLSALDWKARAVVAATLASAIDLTVDGRTAYELMVYLLLRYLAPLLWSMSVAK
ncbi:dna replication helicase dna2, putative [Perkinsus marinus ATCC 50983]|uniref:Dna replication helicase dna2, putative n=1 Tax=Perkinsus marinus (strain ATCC 50983 / TXsc) TaxID=423536 RepID=C5M0I1_PERM5|nr:dna replication helicase dna2, putative [Perkinsus marinus ATCC 50983]EEQ97516.1 dna replication helicase dna2, putative [Perkinsus marinus ATCC 50983]|eukprot:XP_002764799.1 dna replication helicase dna2, putative [Perkinsus marinus ATCC 50983]